MLKLFVILATTFAFSNLALAADADSSKSSATTEVSKDAAKGSASGSASQGSDDAMTDEDKAAK